MPLKIIRQDITKIECDAIVNPTNRFLEPSGGADLAIHNAAGEELYEHCQKLGGCELGKAVITPAFKLPSRFVIHTVGPNWLKEANPAQILASCYRESLALAVKNGCESVAFPLIGAGTYGCPSAEVLQIATNEISGFLFENEMLVYLVVYDKSAFDVSKKVFFDVDAYIDDNYVEARSETRPMLVDSCEYSFSRDRFEEKNLRFPTCKAATCGASVPSLDDMIRNMDKGFADTLFFYIDKKGITDVEAYKRSNVDKKVFSKIKCNKNYKPSKVTAVSFAIGLRLNEEETNHLLCAAGLSLSNNSLFDVIIRYFVTTGEYSSIFEVNEVLYKYDQVMLGV